MIPLTGPGHCRLLPAAAGSTHNTALVLAARRCTLQCGGRAVTNSVPGARAHCGGSSVSSRMPPAVSCSKSGGGFGEKLVAAAAAALRDARRSCPGTGVADGGLGPWRGLRVAAAWPAARSGPPRGMWYVLRSDVLGHLLQKHARASGLETRGWRARPGQDRSSAAGPAPQLRGFEPATSGGAPRHARSTRYRTALVMARSDSAQVGAARACPCLHAFMRASVCMCVCVPNSSSTLATIP